MQKALLKSQFNLRQTAAIALLLVINFLLKIPVTSMGFFAFTYDQGRDFLEVSKIVYEKNLTLVGQTTGQQGIFYGPTWYYFLTPIFALSNGDPQKVAIFFGFLGIATIMCLYFFLRISAKSLLVPFLLAAIASMSSTWMLGPTNIWNTSLSPILTLGVFYNVLKIKKKAKPINFFLLAICLAAIFESELPWGIVMLVSTLILSIVYRNIFFRKSFLLSLFGFLLVFSPKVIFNLRHNFLEVNAVINYFREPKIYGDQMPIFERSVARLDQYWGIFSAQFTQNNKTLGAVLILILVLNVILLKNYKENWKLLKNDFITKYSLIIIFSSLFLFALFKDIVWEYYLVGLPVTLVILLSRIFDLSQSQKTTKILSFFVLVSAVVINFNPQIFYPYRISWLGDGATYRNQKAIMDYIASQKPQNYGVFAYSPAIFDYPFDYLIHWYSQRGLLEKPNNQSNTFYLIIREASTGKYLKSGWLGDKTKDKTTVIDRKEFPGDLVVEKHIKNEN